MIHVKLRVSNCLPYRQTNQGDRRHDKECKITCFCLFQSLRHEKYLNWQNTGHIISSGFCLLRQAWSSRWVIVYLLLMKTNKQEWSRPDWKCEMSLCWFISESLTRNILFDSTLTLIFLAVSVHCDKREPQDEKVFMPLKKCCSTLCRHIVSTHCVDTLCTSVNLSSAESIREQLSKTWHIWH